MDTSPHGQQEYSMVQTNFTAGALSPDVLGRIDLNRYTNGARAIRNYVVRPQGGLARRPGSLHVAALPGDYHILTLQPTTAEAYIICLGDYWIRIFKNDEPVTFKNLSQVLVSPYSLAQAKELTQVESVDSLYMYHPNIKTKVLSRVEVSSSYEDWSISDFDYVNGPYLAFDDENPDLIISNPVHIQKLSSVGAFSTVVAGEYLEYKNSNKWYLGRVLSTSTTPAAPSDPTSDVVYIEPVTSIVRDLDEDAIYIYNEDSEGNNELRSTVDMFVGTLVGSYIRFLDSVDGVVKWSLITGYNGLNEYPRVKITNPTELSDLTVSHTYKITEYTSGYIVVGGGSTYQARLLGESFSIGTGFSLSSPIMTIEDLSTLKEYDCCAVDSPLSFVSISSIPVVEEYVNSAVVKAAGSLFDADRDVGRFLRIVLDTKIIPMEITGVASATEVQVKLLESLPYKSNTIDILADGYSTKYQLGAFYGTNWPRCGVIHEQRMGVGGAPDNPERWYLSEIGKYNQFSPSDVDGTVQDSSAIADIVPSSSLSVIRWFVSAVNLLVGTEASEHQIRPSDTHQSLTPSSYRVSRDSTSGSLLPPLLIDNSVLIVQRSGCVLRELRNSIEVDAFDTETANLTATRVFSAGGGVTSFCYQFYPFMALWFTLADGSMVTLTYDRKQQVYAWATQSLAGDAFVGQAVCVSSVLLTQDFVYLKVIRGGVYNLEKISRWFSPSSPSDKSDMIYLDDASQFKGAFTEVTGLDRFEGEYVTPLVDGLQLQDAVVVDGTLFLSRPSVSEVVVGRRQLSYVQPVVIPVNTNRGSTFGKLIRVSRAFVQVDSTLSLAVADTLDSTPMHVIFRVVSNDVNQSPPLQSGFFPLSIPTGTSRSPEFYIIDDSAYPSNILSVTYDVVVPS